MLELYKKENSARLIFAHKATHENILTAIITQTTVCRSQVQVAGVCLVVSVYVNKKCMFAILLVRKSFHCFLFKCRQRQSNYIW